AFREKHDITPFGISAPGGHPSFKRSRPPCGFIYLIFTMVHLNAKYTFNMLDFCEDNMNGKHLFGYTFTSDLEEVSKIKISGFPWARGLITSKIDKDKFMTRGDVLKEKLYTYTIGSGDALGVNLADKETEREFEGRIVQAIETIEKSEENLDAPSHTLFCMRQATTFVELAGVIYEAVFSIGERQCPDTKTQPFLYTKRTTETLACKKADTRCQPCYIKPNGQFAVCYMRLFKESWRKDLPEKILSQKCIGV
uniref:Uncharacterized protein n=1 Tax=Romanomermis culicivorax TaxID=13658 RepID=A0A915I3X1_ROMCU